MKQARVLVAFSGFYPLFQHLQARARAWRIRVESLKGTDIGYSLACIDKD
jgi:hypothetical protein